MPRINTHNLQAKQREDEELQAQIEAQIEAEVEARWRAEENKLRDVAKDVAQQQAEHEKKVGEIWGQKMVCLYCFGQCLPLTVCTQEEFKNEIKEKELEYQKTMVCPPILSVLAKIDER